jgi:transcriptional regulator with XRE-family HTH domain
MSRIKKLLPLIHKRMTVLAINQEDVAQYLRLDQSSISRRLSGQTPFTLPELEKLDHLLGLDAAMGHDEKPVDRDQGGQLVQEMLKHLSKEGRSEFLLVAALVGEGKLSEPIKSQICDALRLLSHLSPS